MVHKNLKIYKKVIDIFVFRVYYIVVADKKASANGELVKRLRRRPLTAETRVRFPYSSLLLGRIYILPFFFTRKEEICVKE